MAAATPLHVALGTWLTSMGYKPQVLSKICTESASYAVVCTKHVWCTGCTENGTIWSFVEGVLCMSVRQGRYASAGFPSPDVLKTWTDKVPWVWQWLVDNVRSNEELQVSAA
jgi:hypothetical protein